MGDQIVGRDAELAAVERLLGALSDEPVALVGMGAEIVKRERHCARRCFEAGLNKKHRVGHDVGEGEFLTVDLGREKDIDHVVL